MKNLFIIIVAIFMSTPTTTSFAASWHDEGTNTDLTAHAYAEGNNPKIETNANARIPTTMGGNLGGNTEFSYSQQDGNSHSQARGSELAHVMSNGVVTQYSETRIDRQGDWAYAGEKSTSQYYGETTLLNGGTAETNGRANTRGSSLVTLSKEPGKTEVLTGTGSIGGSRVNGQTTETMVTGKGTVEHYTTRQDNYSDGITCQTGSYGLAKYQYEKVGTDFANGAGLATGKSISRTWKDHKGYHANVTNTSLSWGGNKNVSEGYVNVQN